MTHPIAKVDCGACRACCRNNLIMLIPEEGDDPARYDCEVIAIPHGPWPGAGASGYVLKHKPNGDCIHLDPEKGCTVYPHHPAVCRVFDCVAQYLMHPRAERRRRVKAGIYDPEILRAGRERASRKREAAGTP
jgi:Fe-S-cluster containining protein